MRSPAKKYFSNKWRKDHGGAMVEFAIVLPLLLILVFGIIELSLVLHNKSVLTNATREGARAGIAYDFLNEQFPTEGEIKQVVKNYCIDRLIPKGNQITNENIIVTPIPSTNPVRLSVKIENYDHSFITLNFLSLGNSISLGAETVMFFLSP